MTRQKLIALGAMTALAAGGTGVAMAANAAAPAKTTIKVSATFKMKPNRYIQDGMRWDKDVYTVRSGGTLHVVNTVADEGPHTLTVVRAKDLPRNFQQMVSCKVCRTLTEAHGADPETEGPPKFAFLENGVGSATPPEVDRPGDSAVTGEGKKGEFVDLKVTAKKGTTLSFLCLIHPWMQARVKVR